MKKVARQFRGRGFARHEFSIEGGYRAAWGVRGLHRDIHRFILEDDRSPRLLFPPPRLVIAHSPNPLY